MKPYICPECGKPCDAKECDDGLGPIEVWGAKLFDSRPYMASDCCEAELEDYEGDDGRSDYEYDRMIDDKLTGDA